MSVTNIQICRCCLKFLRTTDSRIQTNAKTKEIFADFIGVQLVQGVICGKCNINLLTFDAFQKEIRRKHDEISGKSSKQKHDSEMEYLATSIDTRTEQQEQMIEAVLVEEGDETDSDDDVEKQPPTVAIKLEPNSKTSQAQPIDDDDDDENDVIMIPQEPQVPIDCDEISDEPQPKRKQPEEVIYKCDHCTAVSSKKDVIIRHIRQSHTFKCEICARVYPTPERLGVHELREHPTPWAASNKRKQSLKPMKLEDKLKFRLKSRPYGRPWPSTLNNPEDE